MTYQLYNNNSDVYVSMSKQLELLGRGDIIQLYGEDEYYAEYTIDTIVATSFEPLTFCIRANSHELGGNIGVVNIIVQIKHCNNKPYLMAIYSNGNVYQYRFSNYIHVK